MTPISNRAKLGRMLSVSRPIDVVVWKACVTGMKAPVLGRTPQQALLHLAARFRRSGPPAGVRAYTRLSSLRHM
jgi:hypothetical protein